MVDSSFVRAASDQAMPEYRAAVKHVGLWNSERDIFTRYFKPTDRILDMGCGAGRTTLALYREGYHQVIGIDFSKKMIKAARLLAAKDKLPVCFECGDCLAINFADASFDHALFSFNGLMQIPLYSNRLQALGELLRVVVPGGLVIFTTQDREADPNYFDFWEEQLRIWRKGKQNSKLNEFGDILFREEGGASSFVHIPDKAEILQMIDKCKAHLVVTFIRSKRYQESEAVQKFSSDCRFWIIQKPEM